MVGMSIKLQYKQKCYTISFVIIPDSPSEKYWEELAESRRLALEAALKENENLHNKLSEIEYENSKLKEMYNEACNLVQVLTVSNCNYGRAQNLSAGF